MKLQNFRGLNGSTSFEEWVLIRRGRLLEGGAYWRGRIIEASWYSKNYYFLRCTYNIYIKEKHTSSLQALYLFNCGCTSDILHFYYYIFKLFQISCTGWIKQPNLREKHISSLPAPYSWGEESVACHMFVYNTFSSTCTCRSCKETCVYKKMYYKCNNCDFRIHCTTER